MLRLVPVLALLLTACGPASRDTAPVVSGGVALRADAYLTSLEAVGFSGAVIVRTPEGIVLRKGYGLADDSTATAYTPETVATVGSITKQFTAAAILLLESEGKLSVEDPITRFFKGVPADKQAITLHQLLSHTAGLPGAIGDDFASGSRDAWVAEALATPLEYEPGAGYGYSNAGYSLLAAVVEIVSETGYEQFLHDRLFRPAGMDDTGYLLPPWEDRFLAVGYRDGRRWGRFAERGWETAGVSWNLLGNGGIHSTPDDMMRWDSALADGSVLPSAQVEKMYGRYGPDSPAEDAWYGYGWMVWPTPRGTRLIKHNGGNGIFYADFLRFVDEGTSIFLVTNRSTRAASRVGWTLADLVFDPAATPPAAQWTAPDLEDFPDTPQGSTVRGLVQLLSRGVEADILPFIEVRFAPSFLAVAPMEEHLRILGILQQEMFGRAVGRIRGDGFSFQVELVTDDGRPPLSLSVELGGPSPDLITGIGVE